MIQINNNYLSSSGRIRRKGYFISLIVSMIISLITVNPVKSILYLQNKFHFEILRIMPGQYHYQDTLSFVGKSYLLLIILFLISIINFIFLSN